VLLVNTALDYETPWGASLRLILAQQPQNVRVTASTATTRCPDCQRRLLERVHGVWCPACRGWLVEVTKPDGLTYAFIQGARL
jgi:Zn finger protein HypA/HybF involved in hydrogenase expression